MLLFKQERGELLGLGSVPENAVDNCRPATEGDTVETSREMDLFWVDGRYQGIQIKMLVDSGSSRTMISENRYLDLWKEARPILKTYILVHPSPLLMANVLALWAPLFLILT